MTGLPIPSAPFAENPAISSLEDTCPLFHDQIISHRNLQEQIELLTSQAYLLTSTLQIEVAQ